MHRRSRRRLGTLRRRGRLRRGLLLQRPCLDLGEILLCPAGNSGAVDRRVEKKGVFADDAPAGPGHLDEEVQIRLDDRAPGRDVDMPRIGPVFHRGEFEPGELKRALDSGPLELPGAGQLDLHAVQIAALEGTEIDARLQRLVELRMDLDTTQSQCPGTGGNKQ